MNNGKICVSVCAETADEMIAMIKRAEELADLIEVRCDRIDPSEIGNASSELREIAETSREMLLLRFRSKEGGNCFHSRYPDLDLYCWGADFELDMEDEAYAWLWQHKIFSYHDFTGVPENLTSIYKDLRAEMGTAVKIAVYANDATDAIPLWQLLKQTVSDYEINEARLKFSNISVGLNDGNIRFIPIAMGEPGKWTRIIGLAHGAYMTYCSLKEGDETAPGQLTARDLIETYRVKELDENTEVYGVLGNPVTRSLSPYIHNSAFTSVGLNKVFIPLMVKDLDAFMSRMVKPETREVELNFRGFAVTMPHKQEVMKYLDKIDPTAAAIGAVNTLKIDDSGRSVGYNTDAYGFIEPLKQRIGVLSDKTAAVIGAGGSARACIYALKDEGCDVTVFARDGEKAGSLADEFGVSSSTLTEWQTKNFDIVVNATPVGMRGVNADDSLLKAAQLKGVRFVYDLVTSPTDTPLIREAKAAGIEAIGGLEMLIAQAAKQFEIWTGQPADVELMRASAINLLR